MDAATRAAVRARADNRCEYCHRRQSTSPLVPLHIEHVIPRKHRGTDDADNLALACAECNLHKGSDLTGIDPDSGEVTSLFHPRRDRWDDHFQWEGFRMVGLSAVDERRSVYCN
ncbi:MAG TPA: HNH endonuclease signature motif containing protein [Planctomycetaceae bacterium]|jgi:5-methylcytosine-specific restriction endonuclease McrA|nr:HNH endonuclease signature motif containing protein [Planctomycetaceae bacterium]